MSDESSDDRNDSDEDGTFRASNLYGTGGYDTKNLKSFKHYTREALPHVDHYRNVMSVHGYLARPTLDELHGVQATVSFDSTKVRRIKTMTTVEIHLFSPSWSIFFQLSIQLASSQKNYCNHFFSELCNILPSSGLNVQFINTDNCNQSYL